MIVEAFYKSSNFKRLFDTFWNMKGIMHDGNFIALVTESPKNDNILLKNCEYELRITY